MTKYKFTTMKSSERERGEVEAVEGIVKELSMLRISKL
jgi:hypothetical protein